MTSLAGSESRLSLPMDSENESRMWNFWKVLPGSGRAWTAERELKRKSVS